MWGFELFFFSFQKESIWLGGLFAPEAYITAIRQAVAQSNQWSLEELRMHIEVGAVDDRPHAFRVEGIAFFCTLNLEHSFKQNLFSGVVSHTSKNFIF